MPSAEPLPPLVLASLLFLYVLAFSLGIALCLFPVLRARIKKKLREIFSSLGRGMHTFAFRARATAVAIAPADKHLKLHEPLAGRRDIWVIAALLLAAPIVAVFFARHWITLDGFSDSTVAESAVITGLLAGERLTPPQALPPEAFLTKEILAERPLIATASRDWAQLKDEFSQRLLRVFRAMQAEGYDMVLLEGYRSPARQQQLAAMGEHVTRASAYQSYHQFGLAADCAFLREGKIVISERDPWAMRGYERYGELAEQEGLTWGGRWKLMDFGHVELRRREVMRAGIHNEGAM